MPPIDPRHVRQVALTGIGVAGQDRIGAARVVVAGAGGLGSALLPVLAAAGIGTIVVVDDDVVEPSNLHRQTLFTPADVGLPKAEVAARRLRELGGDVVPVVARLDAGNAAALAAEADLLVDATDDLAARYALDDAAAALDLPLVWGSATAFTGQVGVAGAGGPRWRDLFPVPPDPDGIDTCATTGVLPSLCTTIGGFMASEALKLLTGAGVPLIGRILVVDAAAATVRTIEYGPADEDAGRSGRDRTTEGAPMARIENVPIEELPATAVAQLVEDGADVTLLDVREPWEVELAALPGAVVIPLGELRDRAAELDVARPVVAFCHGGVRSLHAARILQDAGLQVRSMAGGIDAWSRTVDTAVPRY